MTTLFGGILMVSGAVLGVLSAVGIARLRTPLARMHAAAKPASLGLALVAIGAGIAAGSSGLTLLGSLVAVYQFLTAPVAGHLLGRSTARIAPIDPPHSPQQPQRTVSRRWPLAIQTALVWPILWRDLSLANLAAGAVLGIVVAIAAGARPSPAKIRPLHGFAAIASYLVSVVQANLRMAGQVIRIRPSDLQETVVVCDLDTRSEQVALFAANATSFSPGTLTLDISTGAPYRMVVHSLDQDSAEVSEEVHRLEVAAGRVFL